MKVATNEEIRERYRTMADDQLLVLAAESSSLTPMAATALKQEIANRKLSESDLQEASARVSALNEDEEKFRGDPVPRRQQVTNAFQSFVFFVLAVTGTLFTGWLGRAIFNSPQTQREFQNGSFIFFAALYLVWLGISYLRQRRKKRRGKSLERVRRD